VMSAAGRLDGDESGRREHGPAGRNTVVTRLVAGARDPRRSSVRDPDAGLSVFQPVTDAPGVVPWPRDGMSNVRVLSREGNGAHVPGRAARWSMASAHRPMTVVGGRMSGEVGARRVRRSCAASAEGPTGYPLGMSPRPRGRTGSRPHVVLALVASAVLLVAGCSIVTPGFDPTGPCTADGREPGAYPDLEARVPATLAGKAPKQLDSGRNCTPAGLGSLADHGLGEVRFAGAIWPTAAESGTTLAVFRADGLTAQVLGAFYEAGARASSKVSPLSISSPIVQGRPGYRLDVDNDGRLQTIVTWPDAAGTVVRVAIVSGAARDGTTPTSQEIAVQQAIAAFPG
jgi:hypothetical protein